MSESVLRIVIDSRNAEQNARNLSRELNSIEKNGDFATKSMDSMSVSTRALAGYMAGIITVSGAIAKADGYTQQAARIRNATASAEEYDLVQNRVLATAKTTFRDLSEAQEVYLSLAGGMKDLGKNTSETLDLVDSLSFSFTHNATRTDQAQSAMDSLAKSMAKGKIDADAWISIVTGADNIIADMAKTTGMSGAEIRKLGATGKISLEDLIKTLIATRGQNEKLANSMENSFKDGLTNLSTAVTVYLGKANEATSATGILAGGLGVLADNLEGVANVAMLGGVAYLTKAIITQTIATQGAITKSIQRRASLQAEMVAHTQALGLEVQRTRQISALAAQELRMAQLALINAKNKDAQAIATVRLAQAEVAYGLAIKQSSAAVAAETVAQNTLNASRAIGARMLNLAGGWTGVLTIGVTALAAGYMYMSSRTAEANAKLEEQAKVANKTAQELKSLEGVQLKSARNDLSVAFEAQNKALKESNFLFNSRLIAIQNSNKGDNAIIDISNNVRTGLMSQSEAIKALNKLNYIEPNQFKQLQDAASQYETNRQKAQDNANAQKVLGVEVKLMGNEASNAVGKINAKANATRGDAVASRDAAEANREYAKSINNDIASNAFAVGLKQRKAFTDGEIDILTQIYNERRKNGEQNARISTDDIRLAREGAKWQAAKSKAFEDTTKSSAKAAKELAAQQKKDAKDLEAAQRESNELLKESQQILYEYGTEYARIEHEVTNEIKRIGESALKSSDKSGLISEAKALGEARKKLYTLELEENLYGWNWTEEQRLAKSFEIEKARIRSTKGATDQLKKIQIDAIESQHKHELALIKLAKEERIFQMQQGLMHANAASEKYWSLERDRIVQSTMDLDERNRKLAISLELQAQEKRNNLNNAVQQWGQTEADMNGTGEQYQLEQERFGRLDESQNLFDAQLALAETAAEKEAIWQAHHDRMSAIEANYHQSSLMLSMSAGQETLGGLTDLMGMMVGEQSSAYKTMFAAQRALAVAQAIMSAPDSYSKAFNAMVGVPFVGPALAPIAGVTAAATQIAQASKIKSMKLSGFEAGGYTGSGGRKDVAGLVHGQEYVLNAAATKRVGVSTLDAINSGKGMQSDVIVQPQITINVPPGYTGRQTTDSQGNVTIDVVKQMIDDKVGSIANPNSTASRTIQSAFGLAPAR